MLFSLELQLSGMNETSQNIERVLNKTHDTIFAKLFVHLSSSTPKCCLIFFQFRQLTKLVQTFHIKKSNLTKNGTNFKSSRSLNLIFFLEIGKALERYFSFKLEKHTYTSILTNLDQSCRVCPVLNSYFIKYDKFSTLALIWFYLFQYECCCLYYVGVIFSNRFSTIAFIYGNSLTHTQTEILTKIAFEKQKCLFSLTICNEIWIEMSKYNRRMNEPFDRDAHRLLWLPRSELILHFIDCLFAQVLPFSVSFADFFLLLPTTVNELSNQCVFVSREAAC